MRVQVNQDGLKLNVTHQFMVYADDVNILGGSVRTLKKKTEALVVASKETGLAVNADKTILFLSFRRVVNVIYSFLGNSPASEI